jgi:formylglycine-generating enzyme required for sulfatase activity
MPPTRGLTVAVLLTLGGCVDVGSIGGVAIEGGRFTPAGQTVEVAVAAFVLGRTEVTVAAYRRCVEAGSCKTPLKIAEQYQCNWDSSGRSNHPINCISWALADAFCKAQGGRLPTEAEWEWAAAGGTKKNPYPWGGELPSASRLCWAGSNPKPGMTCPVGSHPAGQAPSGAQDLAGNVWEWTADHAKGVSYWIRGGSWADEQVDTITTTARSQYPRPGVTDSADGNDALGFRCAR